jgi:hypothetical protein
MARRILAALASLAIVMSMAGPARADVPKKDRPKYKNLTGAPTATMLGPIERQPNGTRCRVMSKGYAYQNGFGMTATLFVGNLRWCWNRGRVTGGSMWLNVQRCCFWFYERVVFQQNFGCFNGCPFVQKHRRGSFIFNPPWPTITTRLQPWFTLRGNGNGTGSASSGG